MFFCFAETADHTALKILGAWKVWELRVSVGVWKGFTVVFLWNTIGQISINVWRNYEVVKLGWWLTFWPTIYACTFHVIRASCSRKHKKCFEMTCSVAGTTRALLHPTPGGASVLWCRHLHSRASHVTHLFLTLLLTSPSLWVDVTQTAAYVWWCHNSLYGGFRWLRIIRTPDAEMLQKTMWRWEWCVGYTSCSWLVSFFVH